MFEIINSIKIDKYKHFAVSAVLASITKIVLIMFVGYVPAVVVSFFITMVVGICKEIYDSSTRKGKCEAKDLLADAIGALTGAI